MCLVEAVVPPCHHRDENLSVAPRTVCETLLEPAENPPLGLEDQVDILSPSPSRLEFSYAKGD